MNGEHAGARAQLEAERMAHASHERQLRDDGLVCLLFAGLALIYVIWTLFGGSLSESAPMFYLCLALLPIYLAVGVGFRQLAPWVNGPGAVLAFFGLLGQPTGLLIFWLMRSERGMRVLSPGYRELVAATSQLRYQRRPADWLVAILTGLLVIGMAVALLVR